MTMMHSGWSFLLKNCDDMIDDEKKTKRIDVLCFAVEKTTITS